MHAFNLNLQRSHGMQFIRFFLHYVKYEITSFSMSYISDWSQNRTGRVGKTQILNNITKTYLYNSDPLKPNFYIVKLGFTGVYIILLISTQKHRLWVLVRTASPRRFKRVPTIYVLSRNKKNIRFFYLKIFSFWR